MNGNQRKINAVRRATPALAVCRLVAAGVLLSAPIRAPAGNSYQELTINDLVHTAVSVVWATPVEVLLHWEDGGGCICKRQSLPTELSSCYPYDAKGAEQWRQTVFPNLVMNGQVYTNVSVSQFNPVELILRWENGGGGTFKRQELPPELSERYPYDARAAEQWLSDKAAHDQRVREQNRQSAEATQRATEQSREQWRERNLQSLRAQTDGLRAEIRKLDKDLEHLSEVIHELDGRAAGTRRNSPAHQAADRAREGKILLIDQIHQLEEQLDSLTVPLGLNR